MTIQDPISHQLNPLNASGIWIISPREQDALAQLEKEIQELFAKSALWTVILRSTESKNDFLWTNISVSECFLTQETQPWAKIVTLLVSTSRGGVRVISEWDNQALLAMTSSEQIRSAPAARILLMGHDAFIIQSGEVYADGKTTSFQHTGKSFHFIPQT